MKTKKFFALTILVSLLLFTFNAYAEGDDKQTSGYYTTDVWFLNITPYKPVAADHVVLPGTLSQSEIRSLSSLGYYFVYISDDYDLMISGSLIITVFYINGKSSNIICLGDSV